jgi:S-adenosylmethionine synthetase
VDRSAAYAARWVAKNIVEAKLAERCEVQVAYAIGVAEPVSIMVDTFGTGVMPDDRLERVVRRSFDLTPRGIITALKLKRPIYGPTAAYGHFGRKPVTARVNGRAQEFFTWEQPSRVRALLSEAR